MKECYKKSPVTFIIILICLGVYGFTLVKFGDGLNAYEALLAGGLYPPLVIKYHQWYRLFSANFIHFDILHILCNCYSIYVVATKMRLEQLLATKRYIFLILISSLATTGIPCLLYQWGLLGDTIMAGLSGVIFGLVGAMLVLAFEYRGHYMQVFKQIYPSLLLMLVISLLVPSISLVGHVAGMIGGITAMYVMIKCRPLTSW